jgi:hypothetical protein
MKKTLLALCLLSTAAAFAQYNGAGSRSSQPVVYEMPSHPEHAGYAPMSREQSVLSAASYSTAQGERVGSDFPQPEDVSLGTAARELRKQHAQLKKARVIWINQ